MVEASGGDLDAGGRSCLRAVRWVDQRRHDRIGLDELRYRRKRKLEQLRDHRIRERHPRQEEAPQEQLVGRQRRLRRVEQRRIERVDGVHRRLRSLAGARADVQPQRTSRPRAAG